MKCLIVLAVLVGVALAGKMGEEKHEWEESFRMRVEFLCKKNSFGEQWKKVQLPKWVQEVIESRDMEKIKGLCFNVKAHLAAMKKFYKNFADCDPIRQMHFMKASMHHFYNFCLKGQGFDNCLGELFGKNGTMGAMGRCAIAARLNPAEQDTDECADSLKNVEECVEKAPICQGEKGQFLKEFCGKLKQKVDRLLAKKGTDRHSVTCAMMSRMYSAKDQ